MSAHSEILQKIYSEAIDDVSAETTETNLSEQMQKYLNIIVAHSERNKAIITVLTTLLAHKIVNANQDIRYHQAQLPNGFSGRTIDTAEITPFLKNVKFPAMSESGWLTRSLEQPHPYTLNYPGKITPRTVKEAFLAIIDGVEVHDINAWYVLKLLFILLIQQRDQLKIELAKPHILYISQIIDLLQKHFNYKYYCFGASRLPTIAIYAAYQCMMPQLARYREKILLPLEAHNSADLQSGRIGDIDIHNPNGTIFEGVEIKHNIQITPSIITNSYEKFKVYNTSRYYILTTADMNSADWKDINIEIKKIYNIHGCQVIVNGVYDTLKYYLRLLKDPAEFINNYVELLKIDSTIKFQHKQIWNDLIQNIS